MDIFISNLPFTVSGENLKGLFMRFGEVEKCNVVYDKVTKKSKGFGFVTMKDVDAEKAIKELNGSELQKRTINVRKSEKQVNA